MFESKYILYFSQRLKAEMQNDKHSLVVVDIFPCGGAHKHTRHKTLAVTVAVCFASPNEHMDETHRERREPQGRTLELPDKTEGWELGGKKAKSAAGQSCSTLVQKTFVRRERATYVTCQWRDLVSSPRVQKETLKVMITAKVWDETVSRTVIMMCVCGGGVGGV